MTQLHLYGTSACHLCEMAAAMLRHVSDLTCLDWTEIDIADDENLLQRYGLTIPVLHRLDNAKELNWPFSTEEILAFID